LSSTIKGLIESKKSGVTLTMKLEEDKIALQCIKELLQEGTLINPVIKELFTYNKIKSLEEMNELRNFKFSVEPFKPMQLA